MRKNKAHPQKLDVGVVGLLGSEIKNEANINSLLAPDQNPNDINAAKKRSNGLVFKGFSLRIT